MHQLGICRDQNIMAQPEPVQSARSETLNQDISPADQLSRLGGTLGGLEVEAGDNLASINRLIDRAITLTILIQMAHGIATGWLDLNHLSAQIGQYLGAVRGWEVLRQLNDAEAGKQLIRSHSAAPKKRRW